MSSTTRRPILAEPRQRSSEWTHLEAALYAPGDILPDGTSHSHLFIILIQLFDGPEIWDNDDVGKLELYGFSLEETVTSLVNVLKGLGYSGYYSVMDQTMMIEYFCLDFTEPKTRIRCRHFFTKYPWWKYRENRPAPHERPFR